MQDQYGLFLQADKEARMNILGSILGLGIYGGMEEVAADKATDTNRTVRLLMDRVDLLIAGLPDAEKLESDISLAEERQKELEQQVQDRTTVLDSLKVALNTQLAAAGRVMRLNGKITTLTGQKAAKEAAKTSQVGVITAADIILASEAEITAGVAELDRLLEREKELIGSKATRDNLIVRLRRVSETVTQAEHTAAAAREKQNASAIWMRKRKLLCIGYSIAFADEFAAAK